MSVLLVGAAGATGDAVVSRLLDAGDEVRVVATPSEDVERWRSRGAHIALGHPDDDDLIERAAQNTRSIVVFFESAGAPQEMLKAAVMGATRAGVERLIVVCPALGTEVEDTFAQTSIDYIVLVTGSSGRRMISLRPSLAAENIALAVDAADDVAGHPRSVLDLRRPEAWRALKLDQPAS
jgi:NADPH:quinone reductase-like Zn-dependent oxidoreductase